MPQGGEDEFVTFFRIYSALKGKKDWEIYQQEQELKLKPLEGPGLMVKM